MPSKEILMKKLEEIFTQLAFLQELIKIEKSALFANPRELYFAERVMERLINAALDINMHLLSDLKNTVSENYFDSFIKLADLEVYPQEFGKKIAPASALRNILSHEYQELDPEKFHQSLKIALDDFEKYANYVKIFIQNNS